MKVKVSELCICNLFYSVSDFRFIHYIRRTLSNFKNSGSCGVFIMENISTITSEPDRRDGENINIDDREENCNGRNGRVILLTIFAKEILRNFVASNVSAEKIKKDVKHRRFKRTISNSLPLEGRPCSLCIPCVIPFQRLQEIKDIEEIDISELIDLAETDNAKTPDSDLKTSSLSIIRQKLCANNSEYLSERDEHQLAEALKRLFSDDDVFRSDFDVIMRVDLKRYDQVTNKHVCKGLRFDLKYRVYHYNSLPKSLKAILFCLLHMENDSISIATDDEIWMEVVRKYSQISAKTSKKSVIKLAGKVKSQWFLKFDGKNITFRDIFVRTRVLYEFVSKETRLEEFIQTAHPKCLLRYLRTSNYERTERDICYIRVDKRFNDSLMKRLQWNIVNDITLQDKSIHGAVAAHLHLPQALLAYQIADLSSLANDLNQGQQMVCHARINLLGCPGSGKTSFLKRLKGDKDFKQLPMSPTNGIEVDSLYFQLDGDFFKEVSNADSTETTWNTVAMASTKHVSSENKFLTSNLHDASNETEFNPSLSVATDYLEENDFLLSTDPIVLEEKESQTLCQLPSSFSCSEVEPKTVVINDFTGVNSFFSCHQLFTRPTDINIFFFDLKKINLNLTDSDSCSERGDLFGRFTHKEHAIFWLDAINSHSAKEIPILLIGTHSEKMSQEDSQECFDRLWEETSENVQRPILNEERKGEFAIGFQSEKEMKDLQDYMIELIRTSVHWDKSVPTKYITFEGFLKEQRERKILPFEKLREKNESLINSVDDLTSMLSFFYLSGHILYLPEKLYSDIIVVDLEWFVNIFKNIITEKAHARKDLQDREEFHRRGILNEKMLRKIFQHDDTFKEYLDKIMLLLERHCVLFEFETRENIRRWYVPCMNKTPFPKEHFQQFKPSSTLCFVFETLPIEVYHKLIRQCLKSGWKILAPNKKSCVYQTAIVYHHKNQNILIGIDRHAIQVQVLCIDNSLPGDFIMEIKDTTKACLERTMALLTVQMKYKLFYKCKPTLFGDSIPVSFLKESDFEENNVQYIQCHGCPVEYIHQISKAEIILPWTQLMEQTTKTENGTEEVNFDYFRRLGDIGTEALRLHFDSVIPPNHLGEYIRKNEDRMKRGPYKYSKSQIEILFPDNPKETVTSMDFDEALMYKILRNHENIDQPKGGWGNIPKANDISKEDDVERVHSYRNECAHCSEPRMKNDVFNVKSVDLEQAILRISDRQLQGKIESLRKELQTKRISIEKYKEANS